MFHLFRSRDDSADGTDVEAESRRHEAAHAALIEALRRMLEERNRVDGGERRLAG